MRGCMYITLDCESLLKDVKFAEPNGVQVNYWVKCKKDVLINGNKYFAMRIAIDVEFSTKIYGKIQNSLTSLFDMEVSNCSRTRIKCIASFVTWGLTWKRDNNKN